MATQSYSFFDIFEKGQINEIVIPLIQRDYAQGREEQSVNVVRKRFLNSLYSAITETPICLDFIYGDINDKGVLTPLDGQQRLTTLFLLHYYVAKKENVPEEKCAFLRRFSYETRYSARCFCAKLVDFTPDFDKENISAQVINQPWFPLSWKKDPTIGSMLVMLDAIHERFKNVSEIWKKLSDGVISFYFLPIKDMGLTDELYIKMNSRGKPLTTFEHFKAELEREIKKIDPDLASRIILKTDKDWTDFLWKYCKNKETEIVDDKFMSYFRFVCDIISYLNGKSVRLENVDDFDLIETYFSAKNEDETLKNIKLLESFFDCWINIEGFDSPSDFLASFMGSAHADNKIVVGDKTDILEDCLSSYGNKKGKIRSFPLNRIILLYAIVYYLQYQDEISRKDFIRRIRIINNLIQNSTDELSERSERNRIPAILKQTQYLMKNGDFDDIADNGFNFNQLTEEKEKMILLQKQPEVQEDLYKLEDHGLLKGQVSIIGLENLQYADRFISLFSCDKDKIDCALSTCGFYAQEERRGRYQFASTNDSAWNSLFHKSANKGFDRTKSVLHDLLSKSETFSNAKLDDLIADFLKNCENQKRFPWEYYYIRYSEFRPQKYGKMSNENAEENPYLFLVLWTKQLWSQNAYIPYLKIVDAENLSKEFFGQRLIYSDAHVVCKNDAYLLRKNDAQETLIEELKIKQDENGIDCENRVDKLRDFLHNQGLI